MTSHLEFNFAKTQTGLIFHIFKIVRQTKAYLFLHFYINCYKIYLYLTLITAKRCLNITLYSRLHIQFTSFLKLAFFYLKYYHTNISPTIFIKLKYLNQKIRIKKPNPQIITNYYLFIYLYFHFIDSFNHKGIKN